MVQSGDKFDKPDIGRRVEYAGLGLYLASIPPSPEAVATAVDKVLGEPKFKQRAVELREEAQKYQPLEIIEREILALA